MEMQNDDCKTLE